MAKVYKNKLQRDAEAKKEARMKKMEDEMNAALKSRIQKREERMAAEEARKAEEKRIEEERVESERLEELKRQEEEKAAELARIEEEIEAQKAEMARVEAEMQAEAEAKKAAEEAKKQARKEEQAKRTATIKSAEKRYRGLARMSDEKIAGRLAEIEKRKVEIDTQIRSIYGDESRIDEIEELMDEERDLKKEQADLENIPKVKGQIARVIEIRNSFVAKRKENFAVAKKELKDSKTELKSVEKQIRDAEARRIRLMIVESEIAEIKAYTDSLKTLSSEELADEQKNFDKKSKKYESLLKERTELKEQVEEPGLLERREELAEQVGKLQEKVDAYNNGTSKEDSVINKCNMAWMMLLEGKSWDEINLRAVETLKARNPKVVEEKPTPEPQPEPTPEPEPQPEPDPEPEPQPEPQPEPEPAPEPQPEPQPQPAPEPVPQPKNNNLPAQSKRKFADRFPRFANTKIGAFIAGILDRKINEEERVAAIREGFRNPEGIGGPRILGEDDIPPMPESVLEPEPQPAPEPVPQPEPEPVPEPELQPEPDEESPLKERRDAFMDYLSKMAQEPKETRKDGTMDAWRKANEQQEEKNEEER